MSRFAEVLESYPRLTAVGIKDPAAPGFVEARVALAGAEVQVQAVCRWLRREVPQAPVRQPARMRRQVNSYWVKHIAERALGTYVPNGVLIAAALSEGYPVSPSDDPLDPNMYFGMDRKVLAALDI